MSATSPNENTGGNTPTNAASSAIWQRLGFVAAAIGVVMLVLWFQRPRLTEERVQETIISTLASEAKESFYVTGVLTFSSTVERQNEKTFLPGILNLSLGTTRATVRVPGRVTYGFSIGELRAEHIRFSDDGIVDVAVPALELFSVEPELENVEIRTEVGWARLHRSSGQETEQEALRAIRPTMRAVAERHLASSETPELNAAEALVRLLSPALEAGGLDAPSFRFHLASGGVLELDASDVSETDA